MSKTVRFHCSKKLTRASEKSKHGVAGQCDAVRQVLRIKPDYGVPIPKQKGLRKMRVRVQGIGKSGGYRMVYSTFETDEHVWIALHRLYFKGDQEDLPYNEYADVVREAGAIENCPQSVEFDQA